MTPRYATEITKNMHDLWSIDFTYVIRLGRIIKDMILKKKKVQKNVIQFLKIMETLYFYIGQVQKCHVEKKGTMKMEKIHKNNLCFF